MTQDNISQENKCDVISHLHRKGSYLLGGAMHKRSKSTGGGSRSELGSLHLSFLTADLLLDRLLEPSLDSVLPVLVEMLVSDDIVVTGHIE
jgi:hypothetical protein